MRISLETIDKAISAIVRFLALLAGLVLLWLMVLTVVAVVMRKAVQSPILGVDDLSEVSLLLLVFLSMAYCGRTQGHIYVDLIAGLVRAGVLRLLDVIVQLVGGAVLMFIAWNTIGRAIEALSQNEATNLLFLPLYPFYLVVAIGFALYAAVLIVQGIRAASGADNVEGE